MGQHAPFEQTSSSTSPKEPAAPAASGDGLLQRKKGDAAVAGSPRQVTQQRVQERLQAAPRQTAQRQYLETLQRASKQKAGVPINDDKALEREADVMGAKAMQLEALPTTKAASSSAAAATHNLGLLQRKVAVKAVTTKKKKKVVKVEVEARGDAEEFKGGSTAKNNGWNGVEKYIAYAKVGDGDMITSPTYANNYLVAQAGHVLAQQNGGDGGDPDNVFAQDGGANNGPYRTDFENPMRAELDEADDDDEVRFRAVLYGTGIKQGKLEKISENLEASDEDTDFDGFSSDSD